VPSHEFYERLAAVNDAQRELRGLREHRDAYVRATTEHVAKLDQRIMFAEKRLNDALSEHLEECRCLT
jgi:hypothetical protein